MVSQAAGEFSYCKNKRLYVVLRLVARTVVTAALLVMYVVWTYANYGVWFALILAGLFCTMFSVALLLRRDSAPRRPRGPRVRSEVTSGLYRSRSGYSIRVCVCCSSSRDRWLVEASFRSRGAEFEPADA